MEHNIYIVIIEDELEVMEALVNDLEEFEPHFPIETANNAEEAETVIEEIISAKNTVGLLLCDHVLPGKNGIDLLIELQKLPETKKSKKILVTGQAGHEDTILAINNANLNHYLAKPWDKENLVEIVKEELTDFVIEHKKDPLSYMSILNAEKISAAIRQDSMTDH